MGNEIVYLMPTKYKIFLGKGALPPYNNPLDPYENFAHRLSFPQFKIAKGGIGGSMESLVEMVQIENSLRYYVNFTFLNGVSWAFKTLKPMSFRGLRPLDPWCHDGISD